MGACTCAACLAKADDATLARMEAALLGLRKAATDEEDLGIDLDDEDAEVMGTVFAVFGNGLGQLQGTATTGVELTEADRKQLADAMKAQIEQGLALLSESGKAKLGPVLEQLNGVLSSFADAGTNALQVASLLEGLLDDVSAQGGGIAATGYSPYEWSRLARTELAFSREAAKEAYYVETYGARTDALDQHGRAPLHPACECSETVAEDGNGEFWLVIETTPTACEACNDWADAILASAGL